MTREDALKRLQQCRDNQPDAWQLIVSRDIVDALLADADQHSAVAAVAAFKHRLKDSEP